MTGPEFMADPAMAAALAASVSASIGHWTLDTVELSIYGEARGDWQLYDWPTGSPLHWRALLASRIGPEGAKLHAIELRDQGETGILAVMRVTRGEAGSVCQALRQRYPDLTFSLSKPF